MSSGLSVCPFRRIESGICFFFSAGCHPASPYVHSAGLNPAFASSFPPDVIRLRAVYLRCCFVLASMRGRFICRSPLRPFPRHCMPLYFVSFRAILSPALEGLGIWRFSPRRRPLAIILRRARSPSRPSRRLLSRMSFGPIRRAEPRPLRPQCGCSPCGGAYVHFPALNAGLLRRPLCRMSSGLGWFTCGAVSF